MQYFHRLGLERHVHYTLKKFRNLVSFKASERQLKLQKLFVSTMAAKGVKSRKISVCIINSEYYYEDRF